MSDRYSTGILPYRLSLVQSVIVTLLLVADLAHAATDPEEVPGDDEVISTVVYRDEDGLERTEFAFVAPPRGLPNQVLELYCSSVKLRLYWNGYREEVKQTHRKGIYLRRMARFAKHVFREIRDIDRPFNNTMLSRVDKHFMAQFDESRDDENGDDEWDDLHFDNDEAESEATQTVKHPKLQQIKSKIAKMIKPRQDEKSEVLEEIDASDTVKDLALQGQSLAVDKIRNFAKGWTFKKTALFIYTRWRTMWWMTLSCLYTKYYLWDPALDEFTKLKRSLLMWPDLQLVKLQDLQCKPVVFFRRIMDICKILNPLMRIDFGQFNYNSMSRFKSDS